MRCGLCWSLVYWTRTAADGAHVRVPYGTLIDEPALTIISAFWDAALQAKQLGLAR